MKTVQYFSDEYLRQCQDMTPDQIIRFLDDFRQLHGAETRSSSKLISIKVPDIPNKFIVNDPDLSGGILIAPE